MPSPGRAAWAFLILAVGVVAAVFLPSQVAGCLGPLGVTAIQCASATGILPSVGPGLPALGASVLLAALVGFPGSPIAWPRRLLFAGAGAAFATAAYLLLRPTTWTGAISTGEVITLALPVDFGALAVAGLIGSSGGVVLAWATRQRGSRVPAGAAP
jgi:hypothetical protein